jgi:hypothetical protein
MNEINEIELKLPQALFNIRFSAAQTFAFLG